MTSDVPAILRFQAQVAQKGENKIVIFEVA